VSQRLSTIMRLPFELSDLREAGLKRVSAGTAPRSATPYIVRQDDLAEDQLDQRQFCEDPERRPNLRQSRQPEVAALYQYLSFTRIAIPTRIATAGVSI
jgi:hypothetical protein